MSLTDIIRMIRNPSVDSVLGSFTDLVADLRAIAAVESDKVIALSARQRELARQQEDAENECNRAISVAVKIEALIK